MSEENRAKSVVDVLRKNKKIHDVMLMGEGEVSEITRTPTGIHGLDKILGGGLPHGRIIELVGNPSSGKSTIALHCISAVQEAGGVAVYLDNEFALDVLYARNLGVDVGNLIIQQPDNGEQTVETLRVLCDTLKAGDVIIVDSVAAMVPSKEISGDVGDSNMGVHARLMGQAMRMLTGAVSKSGIILIFINQYRQKLGGMGYGEQKTTPGGDALKYYASIRIEVVAVGKVKTGDDVTAQKLKIKTIKNKTFPPFREFESEIKFGEGIPHFSQLFDSAVDVGIIKKSGAHYTYGESKFHGRENAIEWLRSSPDVSGEINGQIVKILFPKRITG